MSEKKIFYWRTTACAFIAILAGMAGTADAHAQNLSKQDLMGLAREFVTRIGDGFEQADSRPDSILSPKAVQDDAPDRIPDGEELILQLVAGEHKIPLNFDIIAIKQPYGMDVLLEDFFGAADFPIRVDYDTMTAKGWFIRENQTFALDLPAHKLVINGQDVPLAKGDVFEADGEIFVKSTAIEQWFDMDFVYNFNELRVQILSGQPLPAELRYARQNRGVAGFSDRNDPSLPFEEQEYGSLGVPYFDVNLRSNYYKQGDNDARKQANWSVIGAGDFAYLNMQSFLAGTDEDTLTTARLTFSRESENPDLLGPLNAKKFEFGDVSTTRLNIAGQSAQEQGIRITNKDDRSVSTFNTTLFRGDTQPGWDAELYRGDRLLAVQTIGENGQYEFLDVPLFAGTNDFRILLYGPQGEIREIPYSVPVTQNSFSARKSYYDVSVSRSNTVTYEHDKVKRPQDGNPHLVGRFERNLTDNIAAFTGIDSRDEGDKRRTYVESGLNSFFGNTFIDLNAAYEVAESEMGAEAVVRRNFGQHAFRGSAFVATDGFQPGINNENNSNVLKAEALLDGPAKGFYGMRANYALSARYRKSALGNMEVNADANYSTRYKSNVINAGLGYNQNRYSDPASRDADNLSAFLNMRGFFKSGFYRLGATYDITPKAELENIFASYSYPFTKQLDGLFEIEHDLDPGLTEITGTMNWKAEKATISPRISYDTDKNLQASLNVRFGVGYNPATGDFDMFNQRLTGAGGVAARIYLDANGNGLLDEGEELISEAALKAPQARRTAISDEAGIAFIPNLPEGVITDVRIDKSSLYDPYYIPNYEGLSLRPRAGVVTEIDFPIVVAGEIDGTIFFQDADGAKVPARQFKLHLVAPWGETIQTTASAYDGFYLFSAVPPGIYYLVADSSDAQSTGHRLPLPKRLEIKPDGTTFYGEDVILAEGTGPSYRFTSDIQPPNRKDKSVLQHTGPISSTLWIGPFKSRLAAGLATLKIKRLSDTIPGGLTITEPLDSLNRAKDDKMFWIRADATVESLREAENACLAVHTFSIPCEVEIFTHAYVEEKEKTLALADTPDKG